MEWRFDSFDSFGNIIEKYAEEEERIKQTQYNEKVVDWIKSFESEPVEGLYQNPESEIVESIPEYFNYIPIFTTSKKINPKYYLTGETSCKVYEQIDGKKSINQISDQLKVGQNQVYNVCKNLIKMGFIALN